MTKHEAIEQRLTSNLITAPPMEDEAIEKQPLSKVAEYALRSTHRLARKAWHIAEQVAVSHRDFNVAGAATLLLFSPAPRLVHVYGYNVKVAEGPIPNVHAEDMLTAQALRLGGLMLSLVIVGDVQPDDTTGVHMPCLMPCSARCLPTILSHEMSGTHTTLVGVNPRNGATQMMTAAQLHDTYQGTLDDSDILTIVPEGLDNVSEWEGLVEGYVRRRSAEVADEESQMRAKLEHFEQFLQKAKMDQLVQSMLTYGFGREFSSHALAAPADRDYFNQTAVEIQYAPTLIMPSAVPLDSATYTFSQSQI